MIPVAIYYPSLQWWGFALIFCLQLAIIVAGCINISSGYFLPVLCKANTEEKVVALSFDDGPHPLYTAPILDTLQQHNASAAFFCIGKHVAANRNLLQRIYKEGHIVGNHSYCHDFWFDMYRSKTMLTDMQQATDTVAGITGVRPTLFRPPYGVMNPNLKKAILKGRYTPVGWSVRSLDTSIKDKEKLLFRITDKLQAGDIILLHDSMEITASILPDLITAIKAKGFGIERLDKMLNINAYA